MSDPHHDDCGGLHRDLLASGAAINRRRVLRLGARFGAALGALQLAGCSDTPTSPSATTTTTTTTTTPPTTTTAPPSTASCSAHPAGDRGSIPGRRLERPDRAEPDRRGAQRHPIELRGHERHRRRRAAEHRPHDRVGINMRAAGWRGRVSVALRSRGPLLALHAGRHQSELLARRAGGRCQRPGHFPVDLSRLLRGALAAHPLRGLSDAWRRPRTFETRWRPRRSRCRRPTSDLVYAVSGYEQSIRNAAQVTLASDNVFSDGSCARTGDDQPET